MAQQGIKNGRANGLKREIVVRVEGTSRAPAEAVYAVLADLRTHLEWGGERQGKKTRLLTTDASVGPVAVGTEFHTTGADPMGTFADRSVVTEAVPGRALEFVTEARLTTKKGRVVDWTNVHRYELEPDDVGTRIGYTIRVTRISELVGMLAAFNVPGLRSLGVKASARVAERGVRNLARVAEEHARTDR
jgi:uncharacterized protein YndB with AHSA1/START domain